MLGRDLDLGSDPDSEIACKRFLSKPPASTIEPKFIIPIRISSLALSFPIPIQVSRIADPTKIPIGRIRQFNQE